MRIRHGFRNDGLHTHFRQCLDDQNAGFNIFTDAHNGHVNILCADCLQGSLIRGIALNRKSRDVADGLNFGFFAIDGQHFTSFFH